MQCGGPRQNSPDRLACVEGDPSLSALVLQHLRKVHRQCGNNRVVVGNLLSLPRLSSTIYPRNNVLLKQEINFSTNNNVHRTFPPATSTIA